MNSITYIGLDVHKTAIAIAVAEGGRSGEVTAVGHVPQSGAVADPDQSGRPDQN